MGRPTFDDWALSIAELTSMRSTCLRRQVGCLLVNDRRHIIAIGYNGVAVGQRHCTGQEPCPGAQSPSGHGLELCEAIHAEQNALLQCQDVHTIVTCYTTTSPCITCTKLLLNTSCCRIVFSHLYPHTAARELWIRAGRSWHHHTKQAIYSI